MNDDVATVLAWLEKTDANRRPRRSDLKGSAGSLAVHLRHHGSIELAEEMARLDREGEGADVGLNAELALAEALAEYVARNPSHARFEAVDLLLGTGPGPWRRFLDKAAEALRKNPSSLASLRERLEAEPALLIEAPAQVALASPIDFRALAEHHRLHAAARDMWGMSGWGGLHMLSALEHKLMRRADPQAWLRIVERFQFPEPVFDLVGGADFDGMEEIAIFVAAAAPAYREDGTWRSDRMTVFALIAAGVQVLRRHAGLGPAGEPPDAAALDRDLSLLLDSAAGRPDFQWLGHAWLQQLAWQDRSWRAWRGRPGGAVGEPLSKIMSAIAARLEPLQHPVAWTRAEEPLWRLDRLVAAMLPAVVRGHGGGRLDEVVAEAIELDLVPRNGLSDSVSRGGSAFVRAMSAALDCAPEPASWLDEVWRKSFPRHDRLRSWRGREAAEGHDPGALAVAAACAWLIRFGDAPGRLRQSRRLWDRLAGAVTETWLTRAEPRDPLWMICARWLAIRFPSLHEGSEEASARLGKLLRALRSPARPFLDMLVDLRAGDVALADLDAALDGYTVSALSDRAVDDARRRNPVSFDDKQELAELERLRATLMEGAGPAGV
ncbi:MAG TPA: hypothetical protein VF547_04350 [Allosphingosinicella sp.]